MIHIHGIKIKKRKISGVSDMQQSVQLKEDNNRGSIDDENRHLEALIQQGNLQGFVSFIEQFPSMQIKAFILAEKNRQMEIAQHLLSQSKDLALVVLFDYMIEQQEKKGDVAFLLEVLTPWKGKILCICAQLGYLDKVQKLVLENSGLINNTYNGKTALQYAILSPDWKQKSKIIDFLMEQGADLNTTDSLALLDDAKANCYIFVSVVSFIVEHEKNEEIRDKALSFFLEHFDEDNDEAAWKKRSTKPILQSFLNKGTSPETVLDHPLLLTELGETAPQLIFNHCFMRAKKYLEQQAENAEKGDEKLEAFDKKLQHELWEILSDALGKVDKFWGISDERKATIRLIREASQTYKNDALALQALCRVAEDMLDVQVPAKSSENDKEMQPMGPSASAAAAAQNFVSSLSALEYATKNNHRKMMAFLLESGAKIGKAFQIAVSQDAAPGVAEFLVEIVKQKGRMSELDDALVVAAKRRDLVLVISLLKHVAPTVKTLGIIVASFSDQKLIEIFSYLKHPEHKQMALSAAICYGRFIVAGDLLAEGVDINQVAHKRGTLLVSLIHEIDITLKDPNAQITDQLKKSWTEKLKFLLAHGANPEVLSRYPKVLQLLGENTTVKLTFNYLFSQVTDKFDEEEKREDDPSQALALRDMLLNTLEEAKKEIILSLFGDKSMLSVISDIKTMCDTYQADAQALQILIGIAKEAGIEVKPKPSLAARGVRPIDLLQAVQPASGPQKKEERSYQESQAQRGGVVDSIGSLNSNPPPAAASSSGWFASVMSFLSPSNSNMPDQSLGKQQGTEKALKVQVNLTH
ncbi:MAG: hypothetical protein K0Q74_526 [Gammaproteobacteria bacterium]|jgi:ankyrin repeat protein|nr:hypothetical protein [Gammaproteobacteria bacterium]